MGKSFFEKRSVFSIRKLAVGACSVLIGVSFLGAPSVLAEEEGKLQVKVDTQLFRGVHYEIIAYDELGNEWMIHSTRKAIVGEVIGLQFEPEDIHIMRLNETEEEFDARIEEYVEVEEQEAGLINAIEEERDEENNL